MGELEKVAQQCDMSADELEVGCYQTLKQKEITSSLLFGDGM